jgi:CHAT domain-containing protein
LHLSPHGFSLETEQDILERPFAQSVNTYSQKESAMVLSGLALSGANNAWKGNFDLPNVEDGILTAYEISQLDLSNTKLVVLSACETARGRIFPVDGVFGLQRAFKQAGAGSILMSLWKVDDGVTAIFMEHFYKFLFETNDRHKALKMAQDEVKKQYPDAYYWAAWVMLD